MRTFIRNSKIMTNKEAFEYLNSVTGGIMTSRIRNIQTALRAKGILKSHNEEFVASDYAWFIYALFVSPVTSYNKAVEWVEGQWDFWRKNYPEERTGYVTPIDIMARLFLFPAEAERVERLMLDPYSGAVTIQWENGAIEVPAGQKVYRLDPARKLKDVVFIEGEVVRDIAAAVQATIKKNESVEA